MLPILQLIKEMASRSTFFNFLNFLKQTDHHLIKEKRREKTTKARLDIQVSMTVSAFDS